MNRWREPNAMGERCLPSISSVCGVRSERAGSRSTRIPADIGPCAGRSGSTGHNHRLQREIGIAGQIRRSPEESSNTTRYDISTEQVPRSYHIRIPWIHPADTRILSDIWIRDITNSDRLGAGSPGQRAALPADLKHRSCRRQLANAASPRKYPVNPTETTYCGEIPAMTGYLAPCITGFPGPAEI